MAAFRSGPIYAWLTPQAVVVRASRTKHICDRSVSICRCSMRYDLFDLFMSKTHLRSWKVMTCILLVQASFPPAELTPSDQTERWHTKTENNFISPQNPFIRAQIMERGLREIGTHACEKPDSCIKHAHCKRMDIAPTPLQCNSVHIGSPKMITDVAFIVSASNYFAIHWDISFWIWMLRTWLRL